MVDYQLQSSIVDEDESTLYINERYAEDNLKLAKQKENIVSGMGFSALPTMFGDCQESNLVTNITDDFRADQLLSVSEDYQMPAVSVSHRQGELVVKASGSRTRVSPGSEAQIPLPETEVTVEAYKTVEKDPDEITVAGGEDWQEPWRKPNPREYTTKTVTITPRIVTRNYGKLDVVGVRSQAPNYHPDG